MSSMLTRIERYYDSHPLEGEEMGQNDFHYAAVHYLVDLLKWLFVGQPVYISGELNLYRTQEPKEKPITPDLVVVKGLLPVEQRSVPLPSYVIGVDGPPPNLIFEISSPDTWRNDLEGKVALYEELGVQEYFVYDPYEPALWTKNWRNKGRLLG